MGLVAPGTVFGGEFVQGSGVAVTRTGLRLVVSGMHRRVCLWYPAG